MHSITGCPDLPKERALAVGKVGDEQPMKKEIDRRNRVL